MNTQEQIALAWAISELATGLDHLAAVYPNRVPDMGRLSAELDYLMRRWPGGDDVVAEARAFLTEHVDELDELLRRRVRGHGG